MDASEQWWFNLLSLQVEQGLGAPNAERVGPYATKAEAEGALERMHQRSDAFDGDDD